MSTVNLDSLKTREILPTVLVALLGLFFAGFSSSLLYRDQVSKHESHFKETAQNLSSALIEKLVSRLNILKATKVFYKSSTKVDPEEFETFAETILSNTQTNIHELQWIPYTEKTQEFDFQRRYSYPKLSLLLEKSLYLKKNIVSDFKKNKNQNYYSSVYNLKAGKDYLGAGATQVLAKPIFSENLENLEGVLLATVNLPKLVDKTLSQFSPGIRVELLVNLGSLENTKYQSIYQSEDKSSQGQGIDAIYTNNFTWANKQYQIALSTTDDYPLNINLIGPYAIFITVLLISGLIVKLIWDSTLRTLEIEQAVEKRTLDLKRSNEELDRFAYIVAHDFKAPIRGITTYAWFLLEDYGDKLDKEGRDLLEDIIALSKKMTNLMSSLLDYSRLGRTDFAYQETNLDEVLNDVIFSINNLIQENNVDILRPKKLPTIYCDKVRIGEVFLNLITNAVKYNDKEHKMVEISYERDPSKGIIFYIRDDGQGMSEEHYKVVFEIFKRLDHKRKNDGTGVGLTIVKKIIERHNGEIWVESKMQEGSVFKFTLSK